MHTGTPSANGLDDKRQLSVTIINHVCLCIVELFRKRSTKGKADFYHAYVLMPKKLTAINRNIPDQLRILTNLHSMQKVDYILLTNVT